MIQSRPPDSSFTTKHSKHRFVRMGPMGLKLNFLFRNFLKGSRTTRQLRKRSWSCWKAPTSRRPRRSTSPSSIPTSLGIDSWTSSSCRPPWWPRRSAITVWRFAFYLESLESNFKKISSILEAK